MCNRVEAIIYNRAFLPRCASATYPYCGPLEQATAVNNAELIAQYVPLNVAYLKDMSVEFSVKALKIYFGML